MMEERNRDITINDISGANGDGDDLSKRQRTDEHPGILPAIPVTATAAVTTSTNHHHQQHAVSGAPSSSTNLAVLVVVQTRGGGEVGGGQQPQQPPRPINNDNSHCSSSSFHRISISPRGITTLKPPPPITAAAAAAAEISSSSSDPQQRGNDDTRAPKTKSTSTSTTTTTSTSGTTSSNNISSNISRSSFHYVTCLENKNSPVTVFGSSPNGMVVIQQQALPARRRHFQSKLVHEIKRCCMFVLVTFLIGGVYTMQHQPQQHGEIQLPPPPLPAAFWTRWFVPSLQKSALQQQQRQATLMPPRRAISPVMTLRDFLSHHEGFSLAMAPAFFGFYGYFGALAAWEDGISTSLLRGSADSHSSAAGNSKHSHDKNGGDGRLLQHVSGASAGAMAAVLLAAGVAPKRAAEFCETITLSKFADFPGFGAFFRGYKFERVMYDFLLSEIQQQQQQQDDMMITTTNSTNMTKVATVESLLLLQNAQVPVAVTALDIETMQTKILTRGSMARAARASATFPFLFQPVGWVDDDNDNDDDYASCNATGMINSNNKKLDATLIDGGIRDHAGVDGLKAFVEMDNDNHCNPHHGRNLPPPPRRIVQLAVGGFLLDNPPGPGYISARANQVVSISIKNLPMCGPWPSGLRNGPIAVQAAYSAMMAALDTPLEYRQEASHKENDNHAHGDDDNNDNDHTSIPVHYELQLDAAPFWKSS